MCAYVYIVILTYMCVCTKIYGIYADIYSYKYIPVHVYIHIYNEREREGDIGARVSDSRERTVVLWSIKRERRNSGTAVL